LPALRRRNVKVEVATAARRVSTDVTHAIPAEMIFDGFLNVDERVELLLA
jgi:hypothetical protein